MYYIRLTHVVGLSRKNGNYYQNKTQQNNSLYQNDHNNKGYRNMSMRNQTKKNWKLRVFSPRVGHSICRNSKKIIVLSTELYLLKNELNQTKQNSHGKVFKLNVKAMWVLIRHAVFENSLLPFTYYSSFCGRKNIW